MKSILALVVVLFLLISQPAFAVDPPCIQVDGKPFFVIGIYDSPGGDDLNPLVMKELSLSGINTIHWTLHAFPEAYASQSRDFTRYDLKIAKKYGIKVIAALNSDAPWTPEIALKNWGSQPAQFAQDSQLYKRIMQIKDHPALLMYETKDEPAGCFEMDKRATWPSLETLKACYDFIKKTDPSRPVWCNEVAWFWCKDKLSMDRFRECAKICDVYSQDDYPVGGPAYPYCPMSVITEDVDAMMKIVDDDGQEPIVPLKPVLMVLQGQGWNMMASDRPEIHKRMPNKIETRYAAYSSIIHGAKGIMWWGTKDLAPVKDNQGVQTPKGELWQIIKTVSSEISQLKDAYCGQRILQGFKLGDPKLEAALFKHNSKNYLVVTNKSEQSVLDTLINPDECGWKTGEDKKVQVLFEQRTLDIAEGVSFRDSFGPWDTHVYSD